MLKKAEVYILSGFLGAGKTTLLKNILEQERTLNRRIAVVMNELGKISIDSDAVPGNTPLAELLNGCVCCTISGQLEAHLQGLLQQHDLDAIYIETTGAAHPVEVLDACLSPLFADQLSIGSIVTLVDAARWQNRDSLTIPLRKLIAEQISHADVILLNKTDQLSESELGKVVMEIQNLNAKSKLLLTQFANIKLADFQQVSFTPKENHTKTHVTDHLHLKTYVHTFTKPVDLDRFEEFLRNMPETVYRIKGYIRFTHSNESFLFQYSYGMPLYMKEPVKIKNTLVFIGDNLNHTQLEQQLNEL
ncbi:CobW family GTP-binding protein [Metabacillus arenae]|uniref:GTP-binding protein n=1 Tax=Metabacillus arenae TaxID=2771434 RepID=A0A926NNV0_9BACI|nr:GTP-binding protein [Metabacillus arenae]MBD1381357.1 GTP-binding protein [Metabacillus arenae]